MAPLDSPSYGKIVNQKHFQRLLGLIQPEKVVCGGTWQEEALRIAPTVMDAVTWQDPVMGEEIFGPILPVLTFSHIPEVLELLKDRPTAPPYEGAKAHYVLDPEDRDTLRRAAELVSQNSPPPKKRRRKA